MSLVVYFPKNSFLVDLFNKQLKRLDECGWLTFWLRAHRDQRFNRQQADNMPHKISIQNVRGTVVLCGLMLSFCGFVFILELLSNRNSLIRGAIDFFTY